MDTSSNLYKAGRLVRLLGWVSIIALAGIFSIFTIVYLDSREISREFDWMLAIFLLSGVIAILSLYTGTALKHKKLWARNVSLVICILALTSPPIGTLIGVFILYYLYQGWSECLTIT